MDSPAAGRYGLAPTTMEPSMNLRERMDDIRSQSIDDNELGDGERDRQIEWQADYYQAILALPVDHGITMTRADCEALARSDVAPSEMEIARQALHEKFLELICAD
jgi:HSP90 family molecular chaperone